MNPNIPDSMRPKFRCLKSSPQMLEDLRADADVMRLAGAYSTDKRMNLAFAFGYKFAAYAKGMSTWEMSAAKFGHEARELEVAD